MMAAAKLAGLALTVACWLWTFKGQRSEAWNLAMIWCAPLLAFPITLLGRRALGGQLMPCRSEAKPR